MPSAEQFVTEALTPRIFVYGPAKSRKTWWALRAAEAGYRVLYFDFEHSGSIVKQIAPDALSRIHMLEVNDGPTDAFAALFATCALRSFEFWYDEESRRIAQRPVAGLQHFDMRNFGRDTIVVFDSYTAIAVSVTRQYAMDNNIDLADAKKQEWEGYRWCGALLTWMLTQWQVFPCPVIVVGHATNYEKYKSKKGDRRGDLEWVRRQPVSSSNPHGMQIASKFEDVLYFYVQGRTAWIETQGDQMADAGSRIVPPGRYEWDALQFADVMRMAGVEPPSAVPPFEFPLCEGAAAGATPLTRATKAAAPVARATTTQEKPKLVAGATVRSTLLNRRQ